MVIVCQARVRLARAVIFYRHERSLHVMWASASALRLHAVGCSFFTRHTHLWSGIVRALDDIMALSVWSASHP